MSYSWHDRTRALALALVRSPSVTGTPGEAFFAATLRDLLAQQPYFQRHPEHLWVEPTHDDPHERANLFALVRGDGRRALLLAGHYDVVSVENYGALKPWAYEPEALLPRLIQELRANGRGEADARALADLEGGDFLPGRGMLDMKSGLAAGIAVLERFAALERREGSLLLVATPDEEGASHGMRSAVRRMPAIAEQWGLDLTAAINLDAAVDQGAGNDGRAVFLGSVGKYLPAALLVGRPTHAGAPFDGVNANLLAAELTRRIECSPLAGDPEPVGGEAAPPPVSLYQSDNRTRYDVTTPPTAWCVFNLLTFSRAPRAALDAVLAQAELALDDALRLLRERARQYAALAALPVAQPSWRPEVLSAAELRERALRSPGARERFEALATRLSADAALDTIALTRLLLEALVLESGLEGPAAVVGFAALPYPCVALGDAPADERLRATVARHAAEVGAAFGQPIRLRPFFPGISDMSFLAGRDDGAALEALAANTPAWGTRLHFDYGVAARLGIPAVNIGPWGRDYHQRTERLHAPYAFGVLPELLWRVAQDVLATADR
jgi:arginine utilization protein RocB